MVGKDNVAAGHGHFQFGNHIIELCEQLGGTCGHRGHRKLILVILRIVCFYLKDGRILRLQRNAAEIGTIGRQQFQLHTGALSFPDFQGRNIGIIPTGLTLELNACGMNRIRRAGGEIILHVITGKVEVLTEAQHIGRGISRLIVTDGTRLAGRKETGGILPCFHSLVHRQEGIGGQFLDGGKLLGLHDGKDMVRSVTAGERHVFIRAVDFAAPVLAPMRDVRNLPGCRFVHQFHLGIHGNLTLLRKVSLFCRDGGAAGAQCTDQTIIHRCHIGIGRYPFHVQAVGGSGHAFFGTVRKEGGTELRELPNADGSSRFIDLNAGSRNALGIHVYDSRHFGAGHRSGDSGNTYANGLYQALAIHRGHGQIGRFPGDILNPGIFGLRSKGKRDFFPHHHIAVFRSNRQALDRRGDLLRHGQRIGVVRKLVHLGATHDGKSGYSSH